MKSGTELIAEERLRQVSQEGWSAEHDDDHDCREMANAARAYLEHYNNFDYIFLRNPHNALETYAAKCAPSCWPWEESWWKPKDPVRDLIKAGALIAAEIDRLQRAKNL